MTYIGFLQNLFIEDNQNQISLFIEKLSLDSQNNKFLRNSKKSFIQSDIISLTLDEIIKAPSKSACLAIYINLFEDFNEAMTYYLISLISDFYIKYKECFLFSPDERISNIFDPFEIFDEIYKIFEFLDEPSNIINQIKL